MTDNLRKFILTCALILAVVGAVMLVIKFPVVAGAIVLIIVALLVAGIVIGACAQTANEWVDQWRREKDRAERQKRYKAELEKRREANV